MAAVPEIEQLKGEIPRGSPLEQLAAAAELAGRLRARGDELLDQFVDAARTGGSSWTEIGYALGTSKQAAHERIAAPADPTAGRAPFGLTGTAADVLTAAAEHTRELGPEDRAHRTGRDLPEARRSRREAAGRLRRSCR
jgi:hypothetical protein